MCRTRSLGVPVTPGIYGSYKTITRAESGNLQGLLGEVTTHVPSNKS